MLWSKLVLWGGYVKPLHKSPLEGSHIDMLIKGDRMNNSIADYTPDEELNKWSFLLTQDWKDTQKSSVSQAAVVHTLST